MGKQSKKPRKYKVTNNKITVHNNGGTVNINLGMFPDDPNTPESLDKRGDSFSISPGDEENLTEDEPPGPPDMGGSTVYGNMCKASSDFDISWVSVPQVSFKSNGIVFNHAAIRKFGLRQNMAMMICVTPDESAIRFFLGQERFPNNNSINKYGYYRLKLNSGGHKHKQQLNPKTGCIWANPEWLTGRLYQSNFRTVGQTEKGSRRDFPLMAAYPSIVDCLGRLFLDRRFYRLSQGGRKIHNVIYVKTDDIRGAPSDIIEKTIGLFADVVDARRDWATTANRK